MPLIQKMTLTLLSIALLPVFLVGSIFFLNTWTSLRDRELDQLAAIATIQRGRLESLIDQNTALVASYTDRTGLLAIVDHYNQQPLAADRTTLQQSVASLLAGGKYLEAASIVNPAGTVVASTQTGTIGQSDAGQTYFADGKVANNVTSNVVRDADGNLSIFLVGPMKLGGRLIGVAVIESDMKSFVESTADYTGLGDTGETMVIKRGPAGAPEYLLPLRFDKDAALQPGTDPSGNQSLAASALGRQDGRFTGTTDYRGHTVLAATRYLPAADWGLVVKIDRDEAYQPLAQLGDLLVVVMFILSVGIILVAFYLARRLNEPILRLAVAADEVRGGNLSARARVGTKDEIGQLAGTFNAMVENVEKVDQMKSEFVLLTSHQLRTPATAVKGFMAMLLDDYAGAVTPKQRELLKAAYTENERQISVINSILDVARLEAGELVLVKADHDIGQILEASAKGQASLLASHRQTIKIEKPRQPVILLVDADKLQLVIDNLIHNAIKYSPPRTRITVTLKHGAGQTTIWVEDQGIGIARRDLHHLFKRFSRITNAQTTNIQGAGLGLYLAEKLIAMHGGKIEVTSREGVGTRFIITLPNITKEDQ